MGSGDGSEYVSTLGSIVTDQVEGDDRDLLGDTLGDSVGCCDVDNTDGVTVGELEGKSELEIGTKLDNNVVGDSVECRSGRLVGAGDGSKDECIIGSSVGSMEGYSVLYIGGAVEG